MIGTSKIRSTVTTAKVVDSNWQQRQPDGYDDQACNNRRKQLAQRLDKIPEHHFKNTANKACPHQCAISKGSTNCLRRTDKAGACPHNDRQSASVFPKRIQLKQSRNTSHKHSVLNQCHFQHTAHFQHPADDNQRWYISQKHCKDMLNPKWQRLFQRYRSIQFIDGIFLFFFHNFLLQIKKLPSNMREPIFYHADNKMISSVVPKVSVWGRDIRTIPRELYET